MCLFRGCGPATGSDVLPRGGAWIAPHCLEPPEPKTQTLRKGVTVLAHLDHVLTVWRWTKNSTCLDLGSFLCQHWQSWKFRDRVLEGLHPLGTGWPSDIGYYFIIMVGVIRVLLWEEGRRRSHRAGLVSGIWKDLPAPHG